MTHTDTFKVIGGKYSAEPTGLRALCEMFAIKTLAVHCIEENSLILLSKWH